MQSVSTAEEELTRSLCLRRMCRLRLSARVSTTGQYGQWCVWALCRRKCLCKSITTRPQILHRARPCGRSSNIAVNTSTSGYVTILPAQTNLIYKPNSSPFSSWEQRYFLKLFWVFQKDLLDKKSLKNHDKFFKKKWTW